MINVRTLTRSQRSAINGLPKIRQTRRDEGEGWWWQAACAEVDPELFFPEKGGNHAREARRVCNTCPVRQECLDDALKHNDIIGVRGGLTPQQRHRLIDGSPSKTYTRHCMFCGVEFTTDSPHQKNCDRHVTRKAAA